MKSCLRHPRNMPFRFDQGPALRWRFIKTPRTVMSVAFLIIVICGAIRSSAQTRTDLDAAELYDAVVSRLFPSIVDGEFPSNSHSIMLRYTYGPAIYSEFQILIFGQGSKDERYEVWGLPKSEAPISQQIEKLEARLQTHDPAAIASSIRIQHVVIQDPGRALKGIAKQFNASLLSRAFEDRLCIDCIRYTLLFESISSSASFSIFGGRPSEYPLIKWMEAMRREAEAQLNFGRK